MLIRTFNFIIAKWFSHSVCWVPFHFILGKFKQNRIGNTFTTVIIIFHHRMLWLSCEHRQLCGVSIIARDDSKGMRKNRGGSAGIRDWRKLYDEHIQMWLIWYYDKIKLNRFDFVFIGASRVSIILISSILITFSIFSFFCFSSSTLLFWIFMHFTILHGCSINIEWNLIEIRWLFCHKQDRKNATLGIVTAVRMATEIYKYIAWFCYGGSSSQKKLNQNKSNVVRNNEFGS